MVILFDMILFPHTQFRTSKTALWRIGIAWTTGVATLPLAIGTSATNM